MGHTISKEGILPDPGKIEKVKNFPRPKTVTNIRSFLGLASYYRKFIENFSKIAKPMNQLVKKEVPFVWTQEQEDAFNTLKQALISEPILQYPDFNKTFYLMTDGSARGYGAVLSQKDEKGKERVIAYASKSIVGAQKNYNATELEIFAAMWTMDKVAWRNLFESLAKGKTFTYNSLNYWQKVLPLAKLYYLAKLFFLTKFQNYKYNIYYIN